VTIQFKYSSVSNIDLTLFVQKGSVINVNHIISIDLHLVQIWGHGHRHLKDVPQGPQHSLQASLSDIKQVALLEDSFMRNSHEDVRETICRNAIDRGIASSSVDARLTETCEVHDELD
ncbi:hypothetical protein M378DRAFT_154718, partial [Amanita muscaria Koide BX008]